MLTALFVLLAAGAGSSSPAAFCVVDELGYCSERIVTFELVEMYSAIKLNVKLGAVLTIEPPKNVEEVEEAILGNASFFQVTPKKDQIAIWAKVPEKSGLTSRDVINAATNLRVKFKSGRILLLEMRISSDKGVELLKLKSPLEEKKHDERQALRAEVRAEIEAELGRRRENLDNEAHERSLALTAKNMAKRLQCEELDERARRGLMVVIGTMICHLGNEYIILKFQLKNRSRNIFMLGDLQIFAVEGEHLNPLEAVVMWAEDRTPHLAFDKKASGAAVIPVSGGSYKEFAIRAIEAGGNGREITVDGLEF